MFRKTSFFIVFAFSFAGPFLIQKAEAQTLYPDTLWVPVIFYDYWVDNNGTNPDFEIAPASTTYGMVYDTLDAQHKPIPTPIACTPPTSAPCACHLSEWYRVSGAGGSDKSCIFTCDSVTNPNIKRWYWTTSTGGQLTPNPLGTGGFVGPNYDQTYNMRNIIIYDSIPFIHLGKANPAQLGIYEINNGNFFPLDNRGFGNQPPGQNPMHNFGMAMELHTDFTYKSGLNFTFAGDDDCWVFINGKLVVDLGGRHSTIERSISLDTMPGFVTGKKYNLDFFYAERHTTGSDIRITSNIIAAQPKTLSIKVVPSDTIAAGDTATMIGTLYDQFGNKFQTLSDSIRWFLAPPAPLAGDKILIPKNDSTKFTGTVAYRRVGIIGSFIQVGGATVIDTAWLYIKPAAPSHLVIEPNSTALTTSPNADNPLTQTTIGLNQTIARGYAALRDRFGNFVRYSPSTLWGSNQPLIVSVPANGGGNTAIGEGVFTKVGPIGTARVGAMDNALGLKDTVIVNTDQRTYILRIVVRDTVDIRNLQMRSDQDTLLQVLGKPSDSVEGPVPGNWTYIATLGGQSISGQSSWRFKPGDTGHGIIVVSMGQFATPDTLIVQILPGLPKSISIYNSELPPGSGVVPLPNPSQLIPITAGTRFLLVGKVFDWRGVWLSTYQLSALQNTISWGASDRTGNLNGTLDSLTGAVRHFTPTKAYDTVTVINTLRIDANTVYLDTVRFDVNPGPAARLIIEPQGTINLNRPNELDTLPILSNETSKQVYSTVRDRFGNFIRYGNVWLWESFDTTVVTAQTGTIAFGGGIVTRNPTAVNSITRIAASDSTLKDSCFVNLVKYYYTDLRILVGNTPDLTNLDMNTNQDTTLRVQGKRSDTKQWVDISATWQNSANLSIDPIAPTGHSWSFSPSDTGTGWIRVTLNNDDVTKPDTLPVHFTPGPPVRASIEILTPPDEIIAGKPIAAVVRLYDKDGHSYSYTYDPAVGSRAAYHDLLGSGGPSFPEPFIIIDGKSVLLDQTPWGSGKETFLNGLDTVSFTLYNAPLDPTQKHQIFANFTIGADTVSAASTPFILHPDKLSQVRIEYPDGTPVTDTLNLTVSSRFIARGYDQYGNPYGEIIGNWTTTDSLHHIAGQTNGSSISYDPTVIKNERGYLIVDHDGIKDSVYVIISGPLIRLVSAVTRDMSGNGVLDRIELYFNRKFQLPANASLSGLTIIANQHDTLVVSSIHNTAGPGEDDSVWIVELAESHTDLPQTGWTPTVILPLQSAYDLAAGTVTAIDGAGPVVWRVVTYPVIANDHRSDSVVVTFSEPVERWDGGSLNPSDRPMDIFYVWQKDTSDPTRYILVKDMFANIGNLKRDPGKSNTITFTMANGNDLNRGYYLSIADTSREYVTDTTVHAVQPNVNNNPRRVDIGFKLGPISTNNPIRPTLKRDPAAVFPIINRPESKDWPRIDKGGAVIRVSFPTLPPGEEPQAKLKYMIRIFDVIGNVVQSGENPDFLATNYDKRDLENQASAEATVYWNGTNGKGMTVAPGVYRAVVYLQYTGISSKNSATFKDQRFVAKLGIQR